MTSKKMLIAFGGILAFFAGAIWMDYVPVVAPLVAFLEVCAGFACGYFFCKDVMTSEVDKCAETIQKLLDENLKLSKENGLLKKEIKNEEVQVVAKKRKAKKEEKPE